MKKKKIVIAISIIMFTIICFVLFIAYASFSSDISNSNNSIINVNIANDAFNFTVSGSTEINLNVGLEGMGRGDGNVETLSYYPDEPTYIKGNTIDINLKTINNNDLYECTYDLVWTWTSTDQYTTSDVVSNYVAYTGYDFLIVPASEADSFDYIGNGYHVLDYIYGQFEVSGIPITTGSPDNYPSTPDLLISKDFSRFNWVGTAGQPGYKTTIFKDAKIYSNSENGTNTKWIIHNSFYNIPYDQTEFLGKEYSGKVTVENVRCGLVPPTTDNYIVSGDLNTMGSEISLSGENFYVIPNDIIDDDSYITLFAKYPLFVGHGYEEYILTQDEMAPEICNQKGLIYNDGDCYREYNVNESKQSAKAVSYTQAFGDIGYYDGVKLNTAYYMYYVPRVYADALTMDVDLETDQSVAYLYSMNGIPFANNYYFSGYSTQAGRMCRYVYDSNSNLYYYNEQYKNYLENTLGININSVRPISVEQFISFGYNPNNLDSLRDLPLWLYNNLYFTGSSCGGDNIVAMTENMEFSADYDDENTIRPMVVIKKSELQNLLS